MIHATLSERKRAFRIHAIVFVPVVAAVFVVNYVIGPPYWAQWVLLGWGIGLLSHWLFSVGPFADKTEST